MLDLTPRRHIPTLPTESCEPGVLLAAGLDCIEYFMPEIASIYRQWRGRVQTPVKWRAIAGANPMEKRRRSGSREVGEGIGKARQGRGRCERSECANE
jgi:hypothetical protein